MSQPADHTVHANHSPLRSALQGVREAIPLLGGYIPVALSFGLVATQAGFTTWEAAAISALIYAGASQFLSTCATWCTAPTWPRCCPAAATGLG